MSLWASTAAAFITAFLFPTLFSPFPPAAPAVCLTNAGDGDAVDGGLLAVGLGAGGLLDCGGVGDGSIFRFLGVQLALDNSKPVVQRF